MGFSCGSAGKDLACNVGDLGSILGLRRSPGKGNSYSLQYSGLENPMDCIVYGVSKSWTRHDIDSFYNLWKWGPQELCVSAHQSPVCVSLPQKNLQKHTSLTIFAIFTPKQCALCKCFFLKNLLTQKYLLLVCSVGSTDVCTQDLCP